MANVLIIDDDVDICDMLSEMVKVMGHKATSALTLADGLKQFYRKSFDVVLLDVRLPDGNGLNALPEIKKKESKPEVIIITGEGDPDGAELAIKNGAWDYLQKPFSPKKLILQIKRVLQYRDDLNRITKPAVTALRLDGIVGSSPQLKACLDLLAQAADSEVNILITGETGTGKELFARALHENSRRAVNSFVVVDCASLPETLVESLLFGHKKGAFTSADKSAEGLIKQADGGTLFLDEVGELTLSLQRTFLRVLQEHRFRPVGGRQEIKSNFRLVAATNRKLDQMVRSGRFRDDLLYRLRSVIIELPPLRKRSKDIEEIIMYYLIKSCRRYGTETKGLSPDFWNTLYAYTWPGNVRELLNTLESAIIKAGPEPILFPKHLPIHIRINVARASVGEIQNPFFADGLNKNDTSIRMPPVYREFRGAVLAEAEKKYFQKLMWLTKGSIKEACQISGLGRTRLYSLMKKYDISRLGWISPYSK